jgi:hypothetical protein
MNLRMSSTEEAVRSTLAAKGPLDIVELVTELSISPRHVQAALDGLIAQCDVIASRDLRTGVLLYRVARGHSSEQCARCHRGTWRTHRHCIWHWLGHITGWA